MKPEDPDFRQIAVIRRWTAAATLRLLMPFLAFVEELAASRIEKISRLVYFCPSVLASPSRARPSSGTRFFRSAAARRSASVDVGRQLVFEAGHPASDHRFGGCCAALAHVMRHVHLLVFSFRYLLFWPSNLGRFGVSLVADEH